MEHLLYLAFSLFFGSSDLLHLESNKLRYLHVERDKV
jgi:hypothetical protein